MDLFENKNFLLMKDGNQYIFYNSIRHFACRISELDLMLFNLIYIHKDLQVILGHIEPPFHQYVSSVYNAVCSNGVLKETPIIGYFDLEKQPPYSYYLHLTYRCNLACTYCYNKKARKSFVEMPEEHWKKVLDRILPYATHIVLTGGEPTITPLLPYVVGYIKSNKSEVYLEMISNCMTDFENYSSSDLIFRQLDGVVFSCDSLSSEEQARINFDPEQFQRNIEYLRNKYSSLKITISSVYTKCNTQEVCNIKHFCEQKCVNFRNVLIVPNNKMETSLLPEIEEYKKSLSSIVKPLESLRFYCGAGLGVLSIDPKGNVYPCQSLHEKEYNMGNILDSSIEEILQTEVYQNICENFSVDCIPTCRECNVKYICGAGCRSATKNIEGSPTEYPKTLCPYYKEKAINSLKSIPVPNSIEL